jgi:heme exporter protein A
MTALFPPLERQAELKANSLSMSRGGALLFEGVSLNLGPGDVLWVKGDNGIGKTTLLEALSGLSRPETGTVSWQLDATKVPASHIAAYQPHRSFAKPALTAKEDLAFWAQIYGSLNSLDIAIESVGLKDKRNVSTRGLSAGQLKRLALAKLMLSQKPIWIMDEPDAAMDSVGVKLIDTLIEQQLARGGSAIIASHNTPRKLGLKTRTLTLKAP